MSQQTRQRVRNHFGDRCAYCRSPVGLFPGASQIDHIDPPGAGGSDEEENLCLCCAWCNLRKSDRVYVRDPVTMGLIRLFHPRVQKWSDHFRWSDTKLHVIPLTPCGRATIDALDLNHVEFLRSRQFWLIAGWHPATDDA
jgi:hypothetical protein